MRAGYPVRTFDRSTPEPAEKERRKTRVLTPTFRQLPLSQLLFRGMSYPASLRTCGRYEFVFYVHRSDAHQGSHPLMAALIRTRLSFLRTSRSSDDGVPAGNRSLFAHKKSRSCRHTHFGYADNSGYLVSRIRIRCSVVCHKSDKQAGTAAGFLQPISLAPGSCPCVCPGSTTMVSMMHAYGQDRAAFPTFDTDHAVDVFLHVK